MHRSSNNGGVSVTRHSENTMNLISERHVTSFVDEEPQKRLSPKKLNVESCYISNNITEPASQADDHFPMSPSPIRRKKKSVARATRADSPVSIMCPFVDREITKSINPIPSFDDDEELEQPISTSIKKVRFLLDEYGEIDEQLSAEHSFPNYILTPELIERCWSSKNDRKNVKASIPIKCRDLICRYPEYRKAALKVCTMAARQDLMTTKLLEKHTDSLEIMTNPKIRGLERSMFNIMLIPRKSCKTHVYAVLRTQELINELQVEHGGKKYTYDETSALIAEQYTANSQYNIRFSYLMGLADADAAINCFDC